MIEHSGIYLVVVVAVLRTLTCVLQEEGEFSVCDCTLVKLLKTSSAGKFTMIQLSYFN